MKIVNKKWDVIVTGELNIDIILNGIHSFPKMGKDIQADRFSFVLGSSSAIFACNIASLGAKVAFCGVIGYDYFGDFVLARLKERKIDTSMVRRTDECHTGVTIVLNYDNDRAMVTYHGTMALTSMDMIPFDIFKDARHFHMSSCYLLPKLSDKLPEIYQRARQAGMTTSLDPQWDPHEKWNLDLPALMEHLNVFFLTESELQNMTKNKDTWGTMQRICSGKNIIVVKQGKQGSTLYSKESGFLHSGAYLNPEIADAIGAGDSYNAGFIYKFIHGSELAECQDFGSLAGALCTTRPGGTAAFDDPAEIPSIMEQFRKNSEL